MWLFHRTTAEERGSNRTTVDPGILGEIIGVTTGVTTFITGRCSDCPVIAQLCLGEIRRFERASCRRLQCCLPPRR